MRFAAVSTLLVVFAGLASAPARAQHAVRLTWTASPDAASNPSLAYNVYRAPACAAAFAKLNNSPVAATSYTDAGVQPGSYCYQVTSVLTGAEGSPSNQAAVTIAAPQAPVDQACVHRGNLAAWRRCVAAAQRAKSKTEKPAP